jgi:hypothetical protein
MVSLRCRAHDISDFSHGSLQRLNTLHELRDHDGCRGRPPKGPPTGINKPLDLLDQRIVKHHHASGLTRFAVCKRGQAAPFWVAGRSFLRPWRSLAAVLAECHLLMGGR